MGIFVSDLLITQKQFKKTYEKSIEAFSIVCGACSFGYSHCSSSGYVERQDCRCGNNEPLIGATVSVKGSTEGSVTDIDGVFSLKITTSGATVEFKYLGYKTKTMKITQKGTVDLGTVSMEADSHVLSDVVVTSSIAVARKTPVAVSSVAMDFIEEKLGTQEFPEILKS